MKKKDLRPYIMRAVLLSATVFRLWLSYQQMMFIMPGSAPIDDDLYYNWANGIAAGRWLGEYNYLTLSKYPFFAAQIENAMQIIEIFTKYYIIYNNII